MNALVRVGELEYALHQAAEIFKAGCIQRDPASLLPWHCPVAAVVVFW
jgi:hypothetical protein